jgi:hypothetical protein
MFGFFSNKQEKKRKEAHELELRQAHEFELRQSLKAKLARYEERVLNQCSDSTDFSETTLEGMSVRFEKITDDEVTSGTYSVSIEEDTIQSNFQGNRLHFSNMPIL